VKRKAWLTGDQFDLDFLADELLPSGNIVVVRAPDGFYLVANDLDSVQADEVYEAAKGLLSKVNGLARVHRPGFQLVQLSGRFSEEGKGDTIMVTATLTGRSQMTGSVSVRTSAGAPVPPCPPASIGYMELAAQDHDVAEVLAIMGGSESLGWVELYKVYEIVGTTNAFESAKSAAGLSNNKMTLFTRTANHQEAAGGGARHARLSAEPPRTPMPVEEAA
jgi:hypothetical protein